MQVPLAFSRCRLLYDHQLASALHSPTLAKILGELSVRPGVSLLLPSAPHGRFAQSEYRDPCYAFFNEFEVTDSNLGRG
jgi:hypothetical protein